MRVDRAGEREGAYVRWNSSAAQERERKRKEREEREESPSPLSSLFSSLYLFPPFSLMSLAIVRSGQTGGDG